MKIYNYDKDTHEYLSSSMADLDPQATKRTGENVYLLPACATLKKPPATEQYKIACFENDAWIIKDDYRNEYACNYSMSVIYIKEIGPLPDNYIHITKRQAEIIAKDPLYYVVKDGKLIKNPDYDEEKLEQIKKEKLKEALTKAYNFIDNKAVYRFDAENTIEATDGNIGKFTGYALGFLQGKFETTTWTTKEDNVIIIDAQQCDEILTGLGAIQSSIWNEQYIAFKTAIKEAQTIEDLEKINIHYTC